MKKFFFVLLLAVLAFGVAAAQTQGTTTTELTVWGMTCRRCVNEITRTVSALAGVNTVTVNLRASRVTVVHDARVNADMIKRAIEARGYNVP